MNIFWGRNIIIAHNLSALNSLKRLQITNTHEYLQFQEQALQAIWSVKSKQKQIPTCGQYEYVGENLLQIIY